MIPNTFVMFIRFDLFIRIFIDNNVMKITDTRIRYFFGSLKAGKI